MVPVAVETAAVILEVVTTPVMGAIDREVEATLLRYLTGTVNQ